MCLLYAPFKKSPIGAEGLDFRAHFWKFGGPIWPILADWGASGPQKSIPDDLTDLGTQNESSGARLRPDFGHFRQKCERFARISNFNIKKSRLQSLNFLSRSFLSGS